MIINKILAFIMIPLSLIIALNHFQLTNIPQIIFLNYSILGALLIIAFQAITLIKQLTSKEEHKKFSAQIIPLILLFPALLIFAKPILPQTIQNSIDLILACFMFTESIYAMH